ncbi:MAG: hypothetical protein HYZ28_11475 [Myxococcales bacterium]|nr:hypothetical protein [Myxococcales bacterium]
MRKAIRAVWAALALSGAAYAQGDEGLASGVARVEFIGKVQAVLPKEVHVLDDEGNVYELKVDRRTRAFKGKEQLKVEELPEGATVRATFDLVRGVSRARELEVLEDEPEKQKPDGPPSES